MSSSRDGRDGADGLVSRILARLRRPGYAYYYRGTVPDDPEMWAEFEKSFEHMNNAMNRLSQQNATKPKAKKGDH